MHHRRLWQHIATAFVGNFKDVSSVEGVISPWNIQSIPLEFGVSTVNWSIYLFGQTPGFRCQELEKTMIYVCSNHWIHRGRHPGVVGAIAVVFTGNSSESLWEFQYKRQPLWSMGMMWSRSNSSSSGMRDRGGSSGRKEAVKGWLLVSCHQYIPQIVLFSFVIL